MARDREQGLRVARATAARFGLAEDSFRLIRDAPEGDGLVYEATRGTAPAILKIAQAAPDELPARRAKAAFGEYLFLQRGPACEQYRSDSGHLVETIADGGTQFAAAAFRRASGKGLDLNDPTLFTPAAVVAWGRALGRFHALARAYSYGYRPCPPDQPCAPDAAAPLGDWRQEHAFFAQWPVDDRVRQRWLAIGTRLARLPQPPEAFGLIHNDMGPNNMLWDGSTLTVIDFDVANYGWFISDIATGLYSYLTFRPPLDESSRPAEAERFLRPLLAAYRQEYDIEPAWLQELPLFLHYRELLLYTVFANTWGANLNAWQDRLMATLLERITHNRPVLDMDTSDL